MKSNILPRTRHAAAVAVALALGASASCFAGEAQEFELPALRTPAVESALTRAEVRAELLAARANGTLQVAGEAGDSPEVLAAREVFNLAQAGTLVADQRAAGQPLRAEQAQAGQVAATTADATEVRIDIVNLTPGAGRRAEELVVISIDGGDAASQRERAIAVRRQLAAMGIDRRHVYVESTTA